MVRASALIRTAFLLLPFGVIASAAQAQSDEMKAWEASNSGSQETRTSSQSEEKTTWESSSNGSQPDQKTTDSDGNDIGCHGLGCTVDNPDKPDQPDNMGSTPEMKAWEESNRTNSSSQSGGWQSGDPRWNNGWTADSLAGSWTIGEKDGTERCAIKLDNDQIFGLRKAWTSPGCTGGLFGNNRWRAGGRTLDITNMAGEMVASFRRVGPDRFEGSRASDGKWLYMSK